MIYYTPYRLQPLQQLNSKHAAEEIHGVILRHEDGVGCLQPWPTLGDEPLDHHLSELSRGRATPMVEAALQCCRVDGAARRTGINLFTDKSIPLSHATLPDFPDDSTCSRLQQDGFTHVKIKVSGSDSSLAQKLEMLVGKGFLVRLDFNYASTETAFLAFTGRLSSEAKRAVDFIEDPFPYTADSWQAAEQTTGMTLALDRLKTLTPGEMIGTTPCSPCSISVWKPAVENSARPAQRVVITSNMDHAIGQLYAAAMAARIGTLERCGLLTHGLFAEDEFFAQVKSSGPALLAPSGTGLGFDDLIERLPWKRLH
jgi:O-succinylbenzoate synthase